MLYAVLKTLSWLASHTPYKVLVKIGKGLGHLYWHIAKKQRIRAEETIREKKRFGSGWDTAGCKPKRQSGGYLSIWASPSWKCCTCLH